MTTYYPCEGCGDRVASGAAHITRVPAGPGGERALLAFCPGCTEGRR